MSFLKTGKMQVLDTKSSKIRVSNPSLDNFIASNGFEDYKTDDGYIYTRVRAISSRVNKNYDGWPSEELVKSYQTFIGKPIFVDHHNSDPGKARGVVVDASLHVEEDFDKASAFDSYYSNAPENHKPPTYITLLLETDAKEFPKLAKAIASGDIDSVSMGANVEKSRCSICNNWATSPHEYCQHIISKGAHFTARESGKKVMKLAYEDCYDISFFEISYVFDPADETALVHEVKTSAVKRSDEWSNFLEGHPELGAKSVLPIKKMNDGKFSQRVQALMSEFMGQGLSENSAFDAVAQTLRAEGYGTTREHVQRFHMMQGKNALEGDIMGQIQDTKGMQPDAITPDDNPEFYSKKSNEYYKTAINSYRQCLHCESDMEDGVCPIHKTADATWDAWSGNPNADNTGLHDWEVGDLMDAPYSGEQEFTDKPQPVDNSLVGKVYQALEIISTPGFDYGNDDGTFYKFLEQLYWDLPESLRQSISIVMGDLASGTPNANGKAKIILDGMMTKLEFLRNKSNEASVKTSEAPLPQFMHQTAPEPVNTLRAESVCPQCGSDAEDGSCEVCGYEQPPDGLDNPDLSKAQEVMDNMQQIAPPEAPMPMDPSAMAPPPQGTPPAAPMPGAGGGMPVANLNSNKKASSANLNNGNWNVGMKVASTKREVPILPIKRITSDLPTDKKTVGRPNLKPVQSNKIGKSNMTFKLAELQPEAPAYQAIVGELVGRGIAENDIEAGNMLRDSRLENIIAHIANGVLAASPDSGVGADQTVDVLGIGGVDDNTAPDFHAEVEGVGAVDNNPEDAAHQSVEQVTNITGTPTQTWNGMDGQTPAVTNEAFPRAASTPAKPQTGIFGDPTPADKQIDVTKPLMQEGVVAPGTETFIEDSFHLTNPVTNETGDLTTVSRNRILTAIKVAEEMVGLGLIPDEEKWNAQAELENETEETLDARLETLAMVKKAGLTRRPNIKGLSSMPSLKSATSSTSAYDDDVIKDSLW
jgi:uncharacterized protein YoaH (UPF0181 family)